MGILKRNRQEITDFTFPPGHFSSPLPELDYVMRDEAEIFGEIPKAIPGVELREAEQLELLH